MKSVRLTPKFRRFAKSFDANPRKLAQRILREFVRGDVQKLTLRRKM